MIKFLKNFGLGLAWVVLFPFFVVVIAVASVFGAGNFIVEFFAMMGRFFTGKKLFPKTPEEKAADKILEDRNKGAQEGKNEAARAPTQPQTVINNYFNCPPPMPQNSEPAPAQIPMEEKQCITLDDEDVKEVEQDE